MPSFTVPPHQYLVPSKRASSTGERTSVGLNLNKQNPIIVPPPEELAAIKRRNLSDPPGHTGETARKNNRPRSSSHDGTIITRSLSSSSMASPKHSTCEGRAGGTPIPARQLSSLLKLSDPSLFPPPASASAAAAANGKITEPSPQRGRQSEKIKHPRGRQRSPHPADIMSGRLANRSSSVPNVLSKNTDTLHSSPAINRSTSALDSYEVIPNLTITIGNNLDTGKTAEELRQLIKTMQYVFERLRNQKMQAEARVKQLQTDLSIQQQETEKRVQFLSAENELLKEDANNHNVKLGRIIGKLNELNRENEALRGECAVMRAAHDKVKARVVNAEKRPAAAERECEALRNVSKSSKSKHKKGKGHKEKIHREKGEKEKKIAFGSPFRTSK